MKKKTNSRVRVKTNQDGIALITAIFSILLATVIGFALYYSSTVAMTIATNERDNTEAFYLAEAGYNHAFALLNKVPRSQFTLVLKNADGIADTGDELSVPPATGLWTNAESVPTGSKTGGGINNFGANGQGRYWITVKNDTSAGETPLLDTNGVVIVTATGVGRDGSTATIEGAVSAGSSGYPALLLGGNARLAGSVEVRGTNGYVQVNGNLDINGGPCADLYFSVTGNITNPGGLKGAGCTGVGVGRTNQPFVQPPSFNIPVDFKSQADFVLGAGIIRGGKVYDKSGAMIADTILSKGLWNSGAMKWQWDISVNGWIQDGGMVDGTYYCEGNIQIKGNFGSSALPVRVTFIAEGFIYNKGRQYIAPALSGYSLISGTDISLSGKFTVGSEDFEGEGLFYAAHQIQFSGTPTIRGSVIAANRADTISPGAYNLVPLTADGYMEIKGNATIISNISQTGNGLKTITWREVRQ